MSAIRLSTRLAVAAAVGAALFAGMPAVAAPAAATTVAAAAAVAPAVRQDRRVTVVNRTGVTMREFYASNTSRSDWEEDILGADMLRSGGSVRINIDDGSGACRFDVKAVFTDGDEVVQYNINVCSVSTITFD